MSQQTSRAESLSKAAAEFASAEERAAFLDRECAGDAALRAAAEMLLRTRDDAGWDFQDARTVVAQSDATILIPDAGDAEAPISSQPVPGGTGAGGTARGGAKNAPVTLPEESYAVGGEIARGGMGSILEAEDRKLGRKVAMKVMRLEADASEEQRQRFINEATILARLEHPNIVPIHELGHDAQGRLFYTMKLVHGQTLQAILDGLREESGTGFPACEAAETQAGKPVPLSSHYTLDRLLTIFRKICDALSLAHAKGVIHRDLKPENVMVGEFGEVLVMDWGIAKILGDADAGGARSGGLQPPTKTQPRSVEHPTSTNAAGAEGTSSAVANRRSLDGAAAGMTMDGMVMGTPHYMSPEQADGRVSDIDQQSDVFSLGAILYALLTLHPPVEASSIREVLERIKRGEIRPPTEYNAPMKIGGKGHSLTGAATAPKKFQPLPHCPGGKVPAALSAVTMRALSVEKARRYATVAAFAADIEAYQNGFATSAEKAGAWTQFLLLAKRHAGVTAMLGVLLLASLGFVVRVMASERKATRHAIIAGQNERQATRNAELAAKNEGIAQANEKRAEANAAEAKAEAKRAREAEELAEQNAEATRQALAKSALALAEAARREGNGPEMQAALNDVPDDLRDSTWSYLLEQSDTSIARVRISAEYILSVAAHPKRPGVFAVADSRLNVALIEVRTGVRLLEFKPAFPPKPAGYSYSLAISPDGERIAVGRRGTGGIVIHSLRDGTKLLDWAAPDSNNLEFSPDGKLLLQQESPRKSISVWDATTGQLAWSYVPKGGANYTGGTFALNGQQIVTFGVGDYVRVVNAKDGSVIRAFPRRRGAAVAAVAVGTNIAAAAASEGFVTCFDLRDGHVVSEFRPHNAEIPFLGFTPAGDQIVTAVTLADGRQAVHVWQVSTGERVQTLLGGNGKIRGANVHPLSGELLVHGPDARVWNLTGTPTKWMLAKGGGYPGVAFWGSDDLVLASHPLTRSDVALLKLDADSRAVIWKPTNNFERPSVSADGRFAAIGRNASGKDMLILRNPGPQTEVVNTLKFLANGPDILRLSPNGDRVVTIENGTGLHLIDTATGTRPVTLERKDLKKFSDLGWLSGQRLVGLVTAKWERGTTGSEEWVVLWDAATGKIVQTATNRTAMDVLAVAPDGRRFAEAGADKLVRIRDGATLAVQQEFRAHDGPITALAWHPTKPILATASADLSIKLWNLDTGRRLEELRGPVAAPAALAFSPSGQRLACAAAGDPTRIWEPQSLSDQPDPDKAAGWEDLLAPLTPAVVEQTGHGWRLENGVLFSPKAPFATLPLTTNLSGASYQVRAKLRQLAAKNGFHLALPVGDRMVGFDLDSWPSEGAYTGLVYLKGKDANTQPDALHGKQVKDSEQHDLEVAVRLEGTNVTITATLDGQPLYEWSGPTTALSHSPGRKIPSGTLALGANAADWVVYAVKVKRL